MNSAPEDGVATNKAGKEGVVVALFASWGSVFEEEHGGLVDEGKEAEITGVLARGFVDESRFRTEAGYRVLSCIHDAAVNSEGSEVTYVPDLKRTIILQYEISYAVLKESIQGQPYTSACGKRTFEPYTMPFRTPFTSVRTS